MYIQRCFGKCLQKFCDIKLSTYFNRIIWYFNRIICIFLIPRFDVKRWRWCSHQKYLAVYGEKFNEYYERTIHSRKMCIIFKSSIEMQHSIDLYLYCILLIVVYIYIYIYESSMYRKQLTFWFYLFLLRIFLFTELSILVCVAYLYYFGS